MTDWANVCDRHFCEKTAVFDGVGGWCAACWWERYGPRVVFNHERDCGLTNDAGTCECPQEKDTRA